jgi:hypothetical protein
VFSKIKRDTAIYLAILNVTNWRPNDCLIQEAGEELHPDLKFIKTRCYNILHLCLTAVDRMVQSQSVAHGFKSHVYCQVTLCDE